MRVVVQRVSSASVSIDGALKSSIKQGLLIYLGIEHEDSQKDILWLTQKVSALRIFSDEHGLMNLSVNQVNGEFLIISQFTLYAKTKKGNRPSFTGSAPPLVSQPLYEQFVENLKSQSGLNVFTGEFGADMQVSSVNEGPVTILMDSKHRE